MQAQYDVKALSSFLLWFDHTLAKKGVAFASGHSNFYSIPSRVYGLYAYSSPFKPFLADQSVTGTNIISGLYLNNTFITKGQSGLIDINLDKGVAYFNTQIPTNVTISGNFNVKDFSVCITDEPEEKLLFETKYSLKPRTYQQVTGLQEHERTYPMVYLKYYGGENTPAALGGLDWTEIRVRAVVLADNNFNLLSLCSIFRDRARTIIPLVELSEMPFNSLGGTTGYNYTGLTVGRNTQNNSFFLEKVSVSNLNYSAYNNLKDLNPDIFPAIIDFELKAMREPRL